MGKKKKRYEILYDQPADDFEEMTEVDNADQRLRTRIEKKHRGGKVVTIISGYEGLGIDDLTKTLKTSCGVGGSAKDGEIILQGDVRKKAVERLKKLGYVDVK